MARWTCAAPSSTTPGCGTTGAVTGEQAWASLIGPLQVAFKQAAGNLDAIPDDSWAMKLATSLVPAFEAMVVSGGEGQGCVYYAPRNTFDVKDGDIGSTVSVENNASLMAGLKMLRAIIAGKTASAYKAMLPRLDALISGCSNCIKAAFDATSATFRQGGRYEHLSGVWTWHGAEQLAVDCQTWVMGAIGMDTVDGWFGKGTALKVWANTKARGGYKYDAATGMASGVGFSDNQVDQVFSGEWTLGAVAMLRVFAAETRAAGDAAGADKIAAEADFMRAAVASELATADATGNPAVKYANTRYFIPFGWWANPIPALASTGWAVMADQGFNPLTLGGAYTPAK
jgi:hypothetical protein